MHFAMPGGSEPSVTIAEVRRIFNDELADPTDEPTGYFAG